MKRIQRKRERNTLTPVAVELKMWGILCAHLTLNFKHWHSNGSTQYFVWIYTQILSWFTEHKRVLTAVNYVRLIKILNIAPPQWLSGWKKYDFFREGTEKFTATTDFIVKWVWRGELYSRFNWEWGRTNTPFQRFFSSIFSRAYANLFLYGSTKFH